MPALNNTKTWENLKEAFAGESQANRRYLYFAKVADVEGYPEVAGLFKDTADGETGHAHGHLDFLKQVGDPATGKMDFKGFMDAYTQFFGTPDQPNLPARSAVQVAGLASPGVLVEVEVVLAQKSGGKPKAAAKKPS